MSERFVDQAKAGMGTIEKLLKNLPGIRGYVDKELRRDADRRLRQIIAENLDEPRRKLLETQKKLLKGGGLAFLADVDNCVTRLQTLIDRIKTASYGYAGLFDAVKVREEQLDALHRFDVALAAEVGKVSSAVSALDSAAGARQNVATVINQLSDTINELTNLFNKRHQAILSPDLLTESGYAPVVADDLLKDAVG